MIEYIQQMPLGMLRNNDFILQFGDKFMIVFDCRQG